MLSAQSEYSSEKCIRGVAESSNYQPRTEDAGNRFPRVTVIMPVRNAARFIGRNLKGLLAQDYPLELIEVLIVDGRSEDATREIVQRIISELEGREGTSARNQDISIRILDNPLRVVPAGLNIGLQHARGAIIFRLDSHSEMAPDYVRKCVSKLLERPDVACVGGPSVATGSGWIGDVYALALCSPFGVGGRTFRTLRTESYVDTLAFGCYRREVFDEVGEFDPALWRNQDIEFSARLRSAGYRLLLICDTQTTYHPPRSFRGVVRQSYNNGYWNTRVLNKMAGVLSWRHFVPGLFVLAVLICGVAAWTLPLGQYLLFLVCGSYLLASLTSSASVALQAGSPNALLLPIVFAAMHVSYGVGSLVGLCRYCAERVSRFLRGPKK